MSRFRHLILASLIIGSMLSLATILPVESRPASNVLLFDGFINGQPRSQQSGVQSTWDGISLWTLNNVGGSTVWFPSHTFARFSNFQFSWPPAVSLMSKGQWTVGPRLVLLLHLRLLNFTSSGGGWQTALDWGLGSAVMGDGHEPVTGRTGVFVGGECVETTPGSVLTRDNLLGQWLKANITLYAPTQTMFFSVSHANGVLIGQTSSGPLCGTGFGTLPVHVLFFASFGIADIDSITLTT